MRHHSNLSPSGREWKVEDNGGGVVNERIGKNTLTSRKGLASGLTNL